MKNNSLIFCFILLCCFLPFNPISGFESSLSNIPGSIDIIHLEKLFAFADSFNKELFDSSSYFTVHDQNSLIGYAFIGDNDGLVGPIITLTGISEDGICSGILPISHNETPQYFVLLEKRGFFDNFIGIRIDILDVDNRNFNDYEIDAITGATISSSAVIENFWEAALLYNKITETENQ